MLKFLVLLLSILIVLFFKYNNCKKEKTILSHQELLCIKVRHLALQKFRILINEFINDLDKEEIKKNLIIKILEEDDNLNYEDVTSIVDAFIDKLIKSANL